MDRKASVVWKGARDGTGTLTTESGVLFETQYSFRTAFAEGIGTNPDELIAAALGGCFSMALSSELGLAGFYPESIETTATATMQELPAGWTMTRMLLEVRAKVPEVSQATFIDAALAAKTNAHVVRFGRAASADVRAEGVSLDGDARASFTLVSGDERAEVTLRIPGEHMVSNALAAAAAARAAGVSLQGAAEGLGPGALRAGLAGAGGEERALTTASLAARPHGRLVGGLLRRRFDGHAAVEQGDQQREAERERWTHAVPVRDRPRGHDGGS